MIADIVVGLRYGDEGKGKVTHHLLKTGGYTHCLRFNGGGNAGHTIYHKGKKFVTHLIPAGVFFGVKSIIGNGCVINMEKLEEEIRTLEVGGVQVEGLLYIAENAHIVLPSYIEEDMKDTEIGTTKTGNGPTYSAKYSRRGMRAVDYLKGSQYEDYLINLVDEFHRGDTSPLILCEGAQGYGLDIDWGDYPYVTSSHCTAASALLNAIPPQAVRDVFGITKAYDTYVGAKEFHGDHEVFNRLQEVGNEFGATTGRPRQCNWLNLKELTDAIAVNGVTHLIVNKVDVLEEVGEFNFLLNDTQEMFCNDVKTWEMAFENAVCSIRDYNIERIIFSRSPEEI